MCCCVLFGVVLFVVAHYDAYIVCLSPHLGSSAPLVSSQEPSANSCLPWSCLPRSPSALGAQRPSNLARRCFEGHLDALGYCRSGRLPHRPKRPEPEKQVKSIGMKIVGGHRRRDSASVPPHPQGSHRRHGSHRRQAISSHRRKAQALATH